MAGIFGAWNADGRTVERSTAARMSDALAHRGPDSGVHVDGSFALGRRFLPSSCEPNNGAQPVSPHRAPGWSLTDASTIESS